ncbi:MAG: hemolysin family protein [Desulfobacteraceae bacterium]|nr:hemolysin family protein [Desulfobacteraceae bacterium]MCF8094236.1 hemolysin family protein [Desulfobacteraceae bacterium]
MTLQFVLLAILILLSGLFSSSETALFSISRTKARHLANSGGRASQIIVQMKENPHRLLSTILIGNNLVNIGASSLATAVTIQYLSSYAVGIATGVMTFLILIFGEIFPKTLATRHNVAIAKTVVLPLFWLSFLFYPVIWFLNFIPKLVGASRGSPPVSEDELITFVDVVHEGGEINPEERELIYNIIKLDDVNVSEIMTPSADMFVIERDKEPDLEKILQSGFTRIPVIEGDIDHAVGIINVKDLFKQEIRSDRGVDIEKIMRAPYFVPEHKKLDQLLNQFKRKKEHAAIVVNEYGEVSGMVSLEDVLEAIVGDIVDETDIVKPEVVKLRDKEWLVLGSADIKIVNEKLRMNIPESGSYETFTGYVLEQIGRIPSEQEQIVIGKHVVTVKEVEGNRIISFIVQKQ